MGGGEEEEVTEVLACFRELAGKHSQFSTVSWEGGREGRGGE